MSQVKSILRKATRKASEPLNILTFPTHENVDNLFASTSHNIYMIRKEGLKDWNSRYRFPKPNIVLLDKDLGEFGIPSWVEFDLILCQNEWAHFDLSQNIAAQLNIPLLCLHHCLPDKELSEDEKNWIRQRYNCLGHIFISEFSRTAWGFDKDGYVVRHTVDFDLFQPDKKITRKNYILSVANQFRERDHYLNFQGWSRVIQGLPIKLVGDNPGLSESAKDMYELATTYKEAKIFFNSSVISPIPSSLLDAGAAGCAIVSTATCQIPSFFTHNEDAFLSNDEKELRYYLELLLKDDGLAAKMGEKARRRVEKECDPIRYIEEWNSILYGACK